MSGDQDSDQRLAAGVNDGVRRIYQKIDQRKPAAPMQLKSYQRAIVRDRRLNPLDLTLVPFFFAASAARNARGRYAFARMAKV